MDSLFGKNQMIFDICSRDRIRTSINGLGDSYGAGIVAHLSKAQLARQDQEKEQLEMQELEDGRRQSRVSLLGRKGNEGKPAEV